VTLNNMQKNWCPHFDKR